MAIALTGRRVPQGSVTASATAKPAVPRASRWTRIKRDRILLLMMLPGVLYFGIFQYIAQLGNIIAFKDYVPFIGIKDSAWVGFQQFTVLFQDDAFWKAFWNSLELAGLQLVFFFPAPLALALLLHSLTRQWVRKLVVSFVYLPHFISWVIVGGLFIEVLGPNGMANGLLSSDTHHHVVNLFTDPSMFKPMMIVELVWKDCGWGTIIFLAALMNIEPALYEAAALDGAGRWHRFKSVTLPSVMPVTMLLLILRLGTLLASGFQQILLQQGNVSLSSSQVIDTYVYSQGIAEGNWGQAGAIALAETVVGLALVLGANKVAHFFGQDGFYRRES
jgi:putative aldouronate transport system permease protein